MCIRDSRYKLRPSIRFDTDVRLACWDAAAGHWRIETSQSGSQGEWTADVLISAGGPLNEPVIPKLPGLETFRGETFHSSRWNHGHDLTGRRVAVIGTGASAIQFVPAIQPEVGRLTLFQRTAAWVMPRNERPLRRWEHVAYQRIPGAQRLMRTLVYWGIESTVIGFLRPRVMRLAQRIALRNLRSAVADPVLRSRLTPGYAMGCKRVLKSNTYYPALTRDNVDVVTEPIAERVRGRDGRSLAEVWQGSPQAYRGTTVAGFPNLFLLLGPNTGLGHNSVVLMIEAQLDYVLGALDTLRRTGARSLEPRASAQRAFTAAVDRRMAGTVWATGGCSSWYIDSTGRNSTLWPGSTWRFRQRMQRFDVKEYEVTA